MAKLLIFGGMALATYFTRYAMLAAFGTQLPGLVQRWLRYVPIAVLAALIAPAVLAPEGEAALGIEALAALVASVVAWRTRSVLWTLLSGMAAFWLLRAAGL